MPKRRTPEIRLEADTNNKHADLYLFGVIGSWWDENTAEEVLSELRSYDNLDTITVYISTVGGTFLDGLPIYNLLKNHPATVTTRVIGYALSMGSVIMLAGDHIEAAQNSLVMIHNAQGIAWGSANDMRATAEIMDKHEQAIIPRYRERMSLSNDEIQALLDAETWYTADEALAAGLIDEIIDPVDLDDTDQQQPENSWKFAAENFRHPPEAFQHRIENALQDKPNWLLSLLNKTVGKPPALPAHLNEPETTDHEDEPVTPEEMQAIAAETVKLLKEEGLLQPASETPDEPDPEPTETTEETAPNMVNQADHDAVVEERDQLREELAQAQTKLAEYEKEVPPSDAGAENTGFTGEGFEAEEYMG